MCIRDSAYPAYLENRAAYTAAERAALREAMEARGIACLLYTSRCV